jgi:hypothetical protein
MSVFVTDLKKKGESKRTGVTQTPWTRAGLITLLMLALLQYRLCTALTLPINHRLSISITVCRATSLARLQTIVHARRRQPTTRVPNVARGTIFNGTLSELKCSNYDIVKKLDF